MLSNLPFYAGHPLLSETGEVIGTFCVLAARPMPADAVPVAAFARYAHAAEAELQGMEREVTEDQQPRVLA